MALSIGIPTHATPMGSLVQALLTIREARRFARGPGGSSWIPADRAAKLTGLRGGALAFAIDRAILTGLIEAKGSGRQIYLRPGPLAATVFHMDGHTGPGRHFDPADLGDHASAPIVAELASEPSSIVQAEALAARLVIDVDETWEALESAAHDGLVDLWPDCGRSPQMRK